MLARAARVSILRALRRLPAARALSSTKKDDDDSTAVLDATIDQLVSRKGLYKVGGIISEFQKCLMLQIAF
jgi:hypothetical protein